MDTRNTGPAVTMTGPQLKELLDAINSGGGSAAAAVMQLVEAQNRTMRRSNAYTPGISPFSHPEGEEAHPKAKLDRETWWLGTRVDESMVTPTEIDALNSLTVSKAWRGDPKYGADITPKRRFVMLPHVSMDERMNLPASLTLACKELNDGQDAVQPEHMAEQLLAMKAELKALSAQLDVVMTRESAELLAMAKQARPSTAAEFGM
jgi:hypothetical protein